MEEKTNVIVSGGSGLVGTRIIEILNSKYDFSSIGRSNGFDITDFNSFKNIENKNAKIFLHLAAKADVDGCEAEKDLGEQSEAWKINVNGTKNVSEFCRENNIKMIYISTDFVFDGEKESGLFYSEEDDPNPINFYAKTKYEGEKVVTESGVDFAILRIAYPYRREFEPKKDFVRAILSRLKDGLSINAVTDHIMCPTYIDDVASAIDKIIETNSKGTFHAVGGSALSPYEASIKIAEEFNIDTSLISSTTRDKYFDGKAPRPFNLGLKNDKIKALGVKMRTFEEGLSELK